jgi:hypothetical protein
VSEPGGGAIERILADIEAEHREWMDLIVRMSPDEATRMPADGWSATQLQAHVAAWKENAGKAARLLAAGEASDPGPDGGVAGILGIDVDRFNEDFFLQHPEWTVEAAVEMSRRVHGELLEALATMPRDLLLGGRFPHGARRWFMRPATVHSQEHREELAER